MQDAEIVRAAVDAVTFEDAKRVQAMIQSTVGQGCERPLGDRWNNCGLISGAGGSFDHKIIENVTNMQDAVLERAACTKFRSLSGVPYGNPREAMQHLRNSANATQDVLVEFYESDPPTKETRRITAVFRDRGCGMTPQQIPQTIFALGASHKEDLAWMQGAFGLGGATTYRNAKAVVLVTRRAPEALESGCPDLIAVAVLLWQKHGKSESAYYLVTQPWSQPGDQAYPLSVPAEQVGDFDPGTHLALISYGVEGYHRARSGGDDRTFEAILNTRLFEPITPVLFSNKIHPERAHRKFVLQGLLKRLVDNPRPDRVAGEETLPYHLDGKTYHLPIRFYVFAKPGDTGQRRNFVAYDHAVVFTSNGQVHKHWAPQEFRYRTQLNKLYDRIFVVVETDELPIEVRTSIFTPDRSEFVRSELALQLLEAVAGFLDECDELRRINSDLIREAITSGSDSRPTIEIARKISRALTMKGFSLGGRGMSGGGSGGSRGGSGKTIDLNNDPTRLEGPKQILAEEGKTKFVTYVVDAVDDFIPKRGHLSVTCTHPDINQREITIGNLRFGRIRVSIAVPGGADTGSFELQASVADWMRAAGGVGPTLRHTSTFEVVPEGTLTQAGSGTSPGARGGKEGSMVALMWKSHEEQEGWDKMTVGEVELVPAAELAAAIPEYAELARMGDARIPTLLLNKQYYALKRYIDARARELTDQGLERSRDRYAVGVGVGLCMIYKETEKGREGGRPVSDDWIASSREALGRSVLSMMPEYDVLAKQVGIEQ